MHIYCQTTHNLKTLWQFENLVFVNMSTRENIHPIARAPLLTVWLKAHNSHVIRVIAVVIRRPGAKLTLIYLSFGTHTGNIVQPYWSCAPSKFTYRCWHSKGTVRGWSWGYLIAN